MNTLDEILNLYGPVLCNVTDAMFIGSSHNNFIVWCVVPNTQPVLYEKVTNFPFTNLVGTSCKRVLSEAKTIAEQINSGEVSL